MELCPLCHAESEKLFCHRNHPYYLCPNCRGLFLGKHHLPDEISEVTRYHEHHNDVYDIRYQNFVSPVVNAVLNDFSTVHKGLDFGAGTGPVITKMLKDHGFQITPYDPFFYPHPELLRLKYDFIVSCEVVEHFHDPAREFELLRSLLKKGSKLYLKTKLYHDGIDFRKWNYKDDQTHVFFYQEETFEYIKNAFRWSKLEINQELIILSLA